jgi:hypothetical protein
VASSPAILNFLLNMVILFDNATSKYEKLSSYLKLCMDRLFRQVVVLMVTFKAYRHTIIMLVAIVLLQFPRFIKFD